MRLYKYVRIMLIIVLALSGLSGCTADDSDFKAPRYSKLKTEYKQYTLSGYNYILGFSPDANTLVALKLEEDKKTIALIDTVTAKETGSTEIDFDWQTQQKRARWSNDGNRFVLSDAWNSSVETREDNESPGYIFDISDLSMTSFGEDISKQQGLVVSSLSFEAEGDNVIYSIYDINNDTTKAYGTPKATRLNIPDTVGVCSYLQLDKGKYLISEESKTNATDEITFFRDSDQMSVAKFNDPQKSVYIKDYCLNRRRVLYFETTLVTEGTNVAGEKIVPTILEFDQNFDTYEKLDVKIPKKYEILNGILSSDGRYALFIAYHNQNFVMVLYDINLNKSYDLLKNTDIGSMFMGTMPGRIDGLFMSKDNQICLVANTGVFIFELE